MNKDYVCSGGRVFVTDEKGLKERQRPITEEELLLENELEISETELENAEASYYNVRESKKPRPFLPKAIIITLGIILMNLIPATLLKLDPFIIKNVFVPFVIPLLSAVSLLFARIDHNSLMRKYRKKLGLEEKIHYLKDSISTKKRKKKELEEASKDKKELQDTEVQKLETKTKQFSETEKNRLDLIYYLGEYREEIIRHYKNGTLEAFLLRKGLYENPRETTEYIAKRFSMEPIQNKK